ncbi:MAG: amidohydrolase family protein, partial [Candidatus Hodarchaeales archaeon]
MVEVSKFIAFTDVNVIPMDKEQILRKQTVLIQNQRIQKIVSSEDVSLPENTVKINGTGKYLIPGLADMHTHLMNTKEFLIVALAYGVTTIRCMWGEEFILKMREQILQGELLGPRIYSTGPIIDGSPPAFNGSTIAESTEEAEQIVENQYKAGYDEIKAFVFLKEQVYHRILNAAKKRNLPVVGHVPWKLSLEEVMEAGQKSVEHLDGYLHMIQADNSPVNPKSFLSLQDKLKAFEDVINNVDLKKLPEAAKNTAESGIWHCPTLVVKQKRIPYEEAQKAMKEPHMKYVPPFIRAMWDPTKDFRSKTLTEEQWKLLEQEFKIFQKITYSLDDQGANILLGTDWPNPFVVPGYSIHEELQLMVDAGLSPYNALKTGTWNAAAFVKALDTFGTVTEGKIADLILLEANPLEKISHSRKIAGVMVQGQWLSKDELNKKLSEMVESYTFLGDFFARSHLLPKTHKPISSRQFRITFNDVVIGKEEIEMARLENGHRLIMAKKVLPNHGSLTTTIVVDDEYQIRSLKSEVMYGDIAIGQMSAVLRDQVLDIRLKIPGIKDYIFQKSLSPCIILLPITSTWSLTGYELIVRQVTTLAVGESKEFEAFTAHSLSGFQPDYLKITVERKPDSKITLTSRTIDCKIFEISLNGRNQVSQALLRVEGENNLISIEEYEQMGNFHYY